MSTPHRPLVPGLLLLLGALGCNHDVAVTKVDRDGDGSPQGEDCNDSRDDIYPGATEICDGEDNDCDGEIDEGLDVVLYPDGDGDGYGDPTRPQTSCAPDASYIEDATDCDDDQPAAHPGNTELCDGIDNDCNGEIDEGLGETWYADADGDGWADADSAAVFCEAPGAGWLQTTGDCDDSDPLVNPDGSEVCDDSIDQDCDGDDTHCTIFGDLYLDSDADVAWVSSTSGARLGAALATVPDVDGNGLDELLVGAPVGTCTAIRSGCATLTELDATTTRGTVDVHTAVGTGWRNRTSVYTKKDSWYGGTVASLGDLNADGLPELGLAAPSSLDHELGGGVVHILDAAQLSGTTLDGATGGITIYPPARYARLASALVPTGDLSGDGYPDLLVAMDGAVESYEGRRGGIFVFHACPEGVGRCVDSDLDGTVDVLAAWASGSTPHTAADDKLFGRNPSDRAGAAADAGFDFNGDGQLDIAVGAPGQATTGAVYLLTDYPFIADYFDTEATLTVTGLAEGDELGASLSARHDLDQDGYDDLIIGAPGEGGTGAVHILLGRSDAELSHWDPVVDASLTDVTETGDAADDRFGAAVSAAGDLNGDGFAELLVGAPFADPDGLVDAGRVTVFAGPPAPGAPMDPLARVHGLEAGGELGAALAGGIDTNTDGYDDVVIGAPGFGGTGRVFLLLGGFLP